MKKLFFYFLLPAMLIAVGCSKDYEKDNPASSENAAYVLGEGAWNANNASISLLDIDNSKVTIDYFAQQNGRPLGDLGQDILRYGSRVYVSVSASGTIEAIDPSTGHSTQIDLGDRYPRYLAADGGKIYVSCYYPRSVVRIDTATLAIEATCPLSGLNPEGICIADGKLYVCNSFEAGSDYTYTYDSTLSVIDLNSFTETSRITVGHNPQQIVRLNDGRLAISYFGDYTDKHLGGVAVIDLATMKMTANEEIALSGMTVNGNTIYTYGAEYDDSYNATPVFYAVDINTLQAHKILEESAAQMKAPYGISINPADGSIYVCDALDYSSNGDLYYFTADGTLVSKYETSPLPKKVLFLK